MGVKNLIEIDSNQPIESMLQQILNQSLFSINAHNGSLMLVDRDLKILQIKARLGEPRGRTTEPVFEIGDSSIAGYVAQTGETYNCPNVIGNDTFAYSRSGELSFKSLLSVPVKVNDKVVAIINADDPEEERFSKTDEKNLEQIAKQVSDPINERIQRLNILDRLYEIGAELAKIPVTGGVEKVLEKIGEAAIKTLSIDLVTLYQYDQERDLFLVEGTGPTIAGKIYQPGFMRTKVYKGEVPWSVVKNRKSGFFPDVGGKKFLSGKVERPVEKNRPRFIERESIKSMATMPLTVKYGEDKIEEIVGVMFANYRNDHKFTEEEKKILYIFADFAAVAIQNIRLEEQRARDQILLANSIAASFAHKMNNMVGTIPLSTQAIRRKISSEEKFIHEQINGIESDSKLLIALAKRLSRQFKDSNLLEKPTPIDINEVLAKAVNRARKRFRNLKIEEHFSEKIPITYFIEPQLLEVLDNIIENSFEAMEGKKDKKIIILSKVNKANKSVDIEISDNGPGISSDLNKKIFSPGFTTKKVKALGLGLWLCSTIMRATGGDLKLNEGKPTTFLVRVKVPELAFDETN